MSRTEQVLKKSIDEVVGGYRPTGDPFVRVEAAVRLRRRRNRAMVGASGAAVVAASVGVVVALPGGAGQGSAGPAAVSSAEPPSTVLSGYEMVPGTVYRVARGTHTGVEWQVGSADGRKGQACLVSRNVLLGGIGACFPTGDAKVHWAAGSPKTVRSTDEPFTVVGVAPAGVARVKVVLADGSGPDTETVVTPTATDTRFFAVLVRGSIRQQVRVQALDAAGSPLGAPVAADGKQEFKDRTPPFCLTGGTHPSDGADPTTGPGRLSDLVAGAPCGTPSSALGRPVAPASASGSSSPPR
ncbi:hypothetical protein OG625_37285 [Streptomyces sp. NBC_01351]|uniref:hypothetical protein n=1 Tax=Streptomyces sp. NBC_01351 TaxID=2903833 RepID=UPI002E31839E|nr:hypothetical protein [Streptomyces sp. NBC_01351]